MLKRIGLKESLFCQQTVVSNLSFGAEAIPGGSKNNKPPSENCWRSPMIYITHSFDFNGVIDEAQDDIGDSDKDDDTNEEEALMHIYFN